MKLKEELLKEMYKSVEFMNCVYRFSEPLRTDIIEKEKEKQIKLRNFFKEWNK